MLIPPETLLIFVPAALAINLTPGNDMLFCLGQGIKSGPKAGMAASLGITAGVFIHTCLAAFGLAAVLRAYPAAFEVIRWAGVLYLVWLAIQAFRHPLSIEPAGAKPTAPLRAFREAVVVSVLNPKIAIFVLAFLPQFVDPSRGSAFLQFLILGSILNAGGTIINAVVGAFAGSIGRWLAGRRGAARAFQMLTGFVFLALAARIAFDRR